MTRAHRITAAIPVLWLCLTSALFAQPSLSENLPIELERLANTGSALMIAAHPDDEHTALLAYLSLGRKMRTGYLSLTRGEGGQNVIGPEKGALLGAIRTEELLAARRIDGGEQFFTSAVDFGYSKTSEETLRVWDRTRIVGDIVRVLRQFRPDVVILVWTGTSADGHGQHQASSILAREALDAAKDPNRYPEQQLQPWATPRVFVIRRSGGALKVDIGAYNPELGLSYTEIAAISRSQHQSQAMGAAQTVGSALVGLDPIGSGPTTGDLLSGIAIGPERLSPVFAAAMKKAIAGFNPRQPDASIPALLDARRILRSLEGDLAVRKLAELDEVLARCAGLRLQASPEKSHSRVASTVPLRIEAINRSPAPIHLQAVDIAGADPIAVSPLPNNVPFRRTVNWRVPSTVPQARFRLSIGAEPIELVRPLLYRHVDAVLGERTQPFAVTPAVSVAFADSAFLFRDASPRQIMVQVQAYADAVQGSVSLELPSGWSSNPARAPFSIDKDGASVTVPFLVTPPATGSVADVRAVADIGGVRSSTAIAVIRYPHIPTQMAPQPASARFSRADVSVLSKTVGYIEGAGDDVPAALRQLGCDVKLLSREELASGDLRRYDAIVTGVRAFNVRSDVRSNIGRLNEYVRQGGRLVVQYNTATADLGSLGPFPLKLGRGRVSVEDAPVEILASNSPVLHKPNAISAADFEGWVQERGLYFPSEWDPKLQTVIASHDPGEKPLPGGILYGRYGDGAYIYTSYSWFRQLPAGVPGAFRLFANLLSQ